jgi:hypothetical protein
MGSLRTVSVHGLHQKWRMFLLPGARLGSKLTPNKRPSSQLQYRPISLLRYMLLHIFTLFNCLSELFHDTKDNPIQSSRELYVHNRYVLETELSDSLESPYNCLNNLNSVLCSEAKSNCFKLQTQCLKSQ